MLKIPVARTLVQAIITHQTAIIGPLAFEQAKRVEGIVVSGTQIDLQIQEDKIQDMITQLVGKYEELFGKASVEACKDAVREMSEDINKKDLPTILQ